MLFTFFPQLRLRGIIYQQIAQLKDPFDGEIITKDQFEKERSKLVNELTKIELNVNVVIENAQKCRGFVTSNLL